MKLDRQVPDSLYCLGKVLLTTYGHNYTWYVKVVSNICVGMNGYPASLIVSNDDFNASILVQEEFIKGLDNPKTLADLIYKAAELPEPKPFKFDNDSYLILDL